MPKQIKYPRLRSHVRKAKSGNVRVYYFYDMRPDGLQDVPLGRDYEEAIEKWRELHEHKPRAKGRVQEAIDRWRKEDLPAYPVESTRRDYTRQLMRIELAYGQCAWDEVDLPSLYAYIDARTAKTQANRELSVFSIVWHKAQLWGMTRLPWPATGIKGWKHKEQPREFTVTDSFSHYGTRDKSRQCKYCAHFVEITNTAAVCNEDGRIHVRSMPKNGCVFFVRETGADDDLLD